MQLSLGLTKRSFVKGEVLKQENEGMDKVLFFIYGKADVIVRLSMPKEQDFVID
jgi:hypothetical protein